MASGSVVGYAGEEHAGTLWTFGSQALADDDNNPGLVFNALPFDNYIDIDTLKYHDGTVFGDRLSILSTATVTGIKVLAKYEGWAGTEAVGVSFQLRGSSGAVGTVIGLSPSGTKHTVTMGGDGTLWGTAWTPAKINSSEFGCRWSDVVIPVPTPPGAFYVYYQENTVYYEYDLVSVTKPADDDSYRPGTTVPVEWGTVSGAGSVTTIELYKDGTLVETIATNIEGTNIGTGIEYDWGVPEGSDPGTTYTVVIIDESTGETATSSGQFTITDPLTDPAFDIVAGLYGEHKTRYDLVSELKNSFSLGGEL